MTKEEIQSIHPESKYFENESLSIKNIALKNGKSVLGVERSKDSNIIFSMDFNGKLHKVTIEFGTKDYAPLLLKLNQLLGSGTNDLNLQANSMGMIMGAKYWGGNDGTKVLLFSATDGGIFSDYKSTLVVERPLKANIDKKSLGLN
jgi:hypothetical protein